MNEIRFYKEFGSLGYLATYSSHGFYKDNVYWKTSEHYYQAQKFLDPAVRKLIIDAPTPKEASNIGSDLGVFVYPIDADNNTIMIINTVTLIKFI